MRSGLYILLSGIFLILLTDTLLFFQLKKFLTRKRYIIPYWFITSLFVAGLIIYHLAVRKISGPGFYYWIALGSSILILVYVPKVILIFSNFISWLIYEIFGYTRKRKYIIRWIFTSLFFFTLLYSVTFGKSNYKVQDVTITLPTLPCAFDQLKIAHISDLHLGSFSKRSRNVARIVEKVNQLQPDLILFTGDMINNFSSELIPWIDELKQLKSRYGNYAILGNHDYGDYTTWPSEEAKKQNLEKLEEYIAAAGFVLLNNAHVPIVLQQDTLILAGVENWGHPPFPQYGDLKKAIDGVREDQFIIMMSHDPAHWNAEIIHYNIPLTLSGHTHAMQMGIKIGGIEWSPAKYVYKEYDGLYQNNGKYIFVSRGVGYLGFAGRIGLRPEIENIILRCE